MTIFFFVDDIQFPDMGTTGMLPTDKVFGYAGYAINGTGLERLLKTLENTKVAVGLGAADPVKHSVDQPAGRVYVNHYGREASPKLALAKSRAFDISVGVLGALPTAGARVLASVCWPFSRSPARG